MQPISDMDIIGLFRRTLSGRKGAEMVEAAITFPIVILSVMLMIRLFAFYMQIIDTSVSEHISALRETDGSGGIPFRVYTDSKEISMFRGGLLMMDVRKEISIRAYLIGEDMLVRAGRVLE